MRVKLLTYVVVGLVFFLSAYVWQWNYFASKNSDRSHRYASRASSSGASSIRDDVFLGKRLTRKLGLPGKVSDSVKLRSNIYLPQSPEDRGDQKNQQQSTWEGRIKVGAESSPAGAQNGSALINPAIILFCYDRSCSQCRLIAKSCTAPANNLNVTLSQ